MKLKDNLVVKLKNYLLKIQQKKSKITQCLKMDFFLLAKRVYIQYVIHIVIMA